MYVHACAQYSGIYHILQISFNWLMYDRMTNTVGPWLLQTCKIRNILNVDYPRHCRIKLSLDYPRLCRAKSSEKIFWILGNILYCNNIKLNNYQSSSNLLYTGRECCWIMNIQNIHLLDFKFSKNIVLQGKCREDGFSVWIIKVSHDVAIYSGCLQLSKIATKLQKTLSMWLLLYSPASCSFLPEHFTKGQLY